VPATLLIALTSPLKQRGLVELLQDMPQLVVVAQSNDAPDALARMRSQRPDVLIVDSAIGREMHPFFGELLCFPRTLILGPQRHVGICPAADMNPACGFASDRVPVEALRTMLQIVANCSRPRRERGSCNGCPVSDTLRFPDLPLSARERQVFERIGRGEGVTAIATSLGVSVKTVESYREGIKHKLGLSTAHELLLAALRWRDGEFVMPERNQPK
jgi:DNA-binding NarL/FixJ family response regulator